MEDLKKRPNQLIRINDSFAEYLKERDRSQTNPYLEFACFFEKHFLYKGSLKIRLIVFKESASWLGIDGQSIPKNHIEMYKFEDEEGSDHKSVSAKLSQWVGNIDRPRGAGKGKWWLEFPGDVNYSGSTNHGGVQIGDQYNTALHGSISTGTEQLYYRY
ncbi:hypothetical protein B0O99DRAFT_598351 [Bisporella sp. PMI_857]|nr:hypothetical protein B0O99DRAFT_598351 [Bisporella sp. PMI_857]